jgi:hypothetical protein
MDRWIVRLPPGVGQPFEVYVNGVRQVEGRDFDRRGDRLLFARELAQEGRVGFWRWVLGAFGVGTYRKDDQVDIRYEVAGRPAVAHKLPIEPPTSPPPGSPV